MFHSFFTLSASIYKSSSNSTQVFIKWCQEGGEEFDRENANLDEDYERAINHVEFFVDWLWGISKNKVG